MTGGETHAAVTPASIARILWRQKVVSAGVFLLILVIGCTVVLVRPRTYESSSSIALMPVSYDTNVLQNYPNLIGSLIPTYVQLVSSPALLDQVAAGLPFHTSGAELANQVSAQSLSNAAVINIVAHSGNPTQARQIAAETTKLFLSQLQGNGVVVPQIYGLPSANPTLAPPGTSLLLTLVFVLALVFALAAGLIWARLPPATSAAAADLARTFRTNLARAAARAAGKSGTTRPAPGTPLPGNSDSSRSIRRGNESTPRVQPGRAGKR